MTLPAATHRETPLGNSAISPRGQTWNRRDPLAPVPSETPKANLALRAYATMGTGRSLPKVAAELGYVSKRWVEEWSSRFHWTARVAAWVQIEVQRAEKEHAEQRMRLRELVRANAEKVMSEAWCAWEASKSTTDGDGNVKSAPGDPRYLFALEGSFRTLRDLYGLDLPKAPVRLEAKVQAVPSTLAEMMLRGMNAPGEHDADGRAIIDADPDALDPSEV